ncbi:MAG: acetolactate synthase [Dehalococcoidales bacterium]|jgi:acetolactate synthase-1/2/3 large subunit|nr:acetolactate synthase [Dehalococcoidales bacterium]MDP6576796.1 thiamine pyrophosphate-binding protein [Dehalococcoidales bacterium]
MKLSDYVACFLAGQGIKHVFLITGSAAVHLIDSIAKNPDIDYICTQHEQSAAMAAEAYSRITENLGAALSTSGPGATNLITGVCCAYFDSIPTIFITGQVPRSQLKRGYAVRQLGFQETDVVSMFESTTKYAVLVDDPQNIKYELEKATHLARTGRPGPVLLDIPDDVQRAEINPDELRSFVPEETPGSNEPDLDLKRVLELITESKRPIVVFGGGIKNSKAQTKAVAFAEKLGFPVALTWAGMDILPHNHPLVVGGFGVSSVRWGNFAVQNSDFILTIGTRLDTHGAGDKLKTFAREAKKIILDVDKGELDKYKDRGMNVDVMINTDAENFFDQINDKLDGINKQDITEWAERIKEWKNRYPVCPPQYFEQKEKVNPYVFMECLSEASSEGDVIITDAGATLTWTMQAYKVKKNQKLFSAFNHSPMGYSLPASMGAYLADNRHTVICVIGDGGIQINIQELATIARHKWPIKIFLIDNRGYGIVRQTQETWLEARYEATSWKGGLALPDFINIALAYGIGTEVINNHAEMRGKLRKILASRDAVLCTVNLRPDEKITPKLAFGRPIEELTPPLDKKEFLKNMLIEPWNE